MALSELAKFSNIVLNRVHSGRRSLKFSYFSAPSVRQRVHETESEVPLKTYLTGPVNSH